MSPGRLVIGHEVLVFLLNIVGSGTPSFFLVGGGFVLARASETSLGPLGREETSFGKTRPGKRGVADP